MQVTSQSRILIYKGIIFQNTFYLSETEPILLGYKMNKYIYFDTIFEIENSRNRNQYLQIQGAKKTVMTKSCTGKIKELLEVKRFLSRRTDGL